MNRIKTQYKTAQNLNTRINIHAKYSTNKQSFADWIISQYEFTPGSKVLELGCGTGSIWINNLALLSGGTQLILTDFSEGMLETAKSNLSCDAITFQQVDVQHIPYPDASFDAVIANMMLYHIPDLHKGLSEIRRVLKTDGSFYCTTYGVHGILEYITGLLQDTGVTCQISTTFTLQNGADSLGKHFKSILRIDRKDELAITDINDFTDYIYSLSGLANIDKIPRDVLIQKLKSRMTNNVLVIPKEYGMFICR